MSGVVKTWRGKDFPKHSGTVQLSFSAVVDGILFRCMSSGKDPRELLTLEVAQGSLVLSAPSTQMGIRLDIEDTYGILFGGTHRVTITFGDFGTRVYLDGYQSFACATNICPSEFSESGTFEVSDTVSEFAIDRNALTSEQIAAHTPMPQPDIEFADAKLADFDVRHISDLRNGTIFARFRVRGLNQFGTILAAANPSGECMNIYIDDDGITYTFVYEGEDYVYHAAGSWNDGGWHDLVVRSFRGAIDIYMDGYMALHQAGELFFDSIPNLNKVSIGEDTEGVRLCGEVRNGGIFDRPLTDGEIKTLSQTPPTTDTALFDKGYEGSASYRIPSMVTTSNGVVIAGADQRVTISNDAPNEIHFIIRRSLDSGETWLPLQTVIAFPGEGTDGASVIDSCMVHDREHGRTVVIIDHFPGGRGFANAEQAIGLDKQGNLILHDADGKLYTLLHGGEVVDEEGKPTPYRVDEDGNVSDNGKPAGNIYLKEGIDPHESLLTARTSYLVEVHSDDDGQTWTKPRFISHMVKEPWMRFMGTSPGNGIQLSVGKHRGRLLIPYYCCGDSPKFSSGGALISDDGGQTWRRGTAINQGHTINGKIVDERHVNDNDAVTHESTFVELANGDVVVMFRNQNHTARVGKAVSHDGGETWQDLEFVPTIPDVFSLPNAVTLPPDGDSAWQPGQASNRVVFANASLMRPYRGCGVLRESFDGGHSWPINKCFNPYHYVYQCMAVLPDRSLGLLWERETAGVYFTKFPLSWLA